MGHHMIYSDRTGELCKTRKAAENNAPEAAVIKKVEGGYMAFDTCDDYETWKNQK